MRARLLVETPLVEMLGVLTTCHFGKSRLVRMRKASRFLQRDKSTQFKPRGVARSGYGYRRYQPWLAADLVIVAQGTKPPFRTSMADGLAQSAMAFGSVGQQAAQTILQAVARLQDGRRPHSPHLPGIY
jgi:hypothetical protein